MVKEGVAVTVVGVTGHQNVPTDARPLIEGSVRDILTVTPPPITGVSSLAAGADQMVAQQVLAVGGRFHTVIPSSDYERTMSGPDLTTYRRLLRLAEHMVPRQAAVVEWQRLDRVDGSEREVTLEALGV